ncbi:SET and MYND domain-containing protein 4 isoform X6 [Nasonia vitripennis]|uniref:SET domain-containing protein n=1 Tax=Nasonia vitripennis TaxID=7425 RepID=A0A7M7R4V1_NASVI|nr:SET and MYND domain-containing protein 4 isoform X6 [Nasonia vitripennis]
MDDVRNLLLAKMKATGKSNEMTFKFKIMTTDESRVAIALNIMEVFQILPQNKCKFKDSQTSINLRHEANRIFISNKNNVDKLLTSWELYSKAIAIAPNTSQELSLAYANRSAVLFCFKKFEECIGDINHALELNYPTHLKGSHKDAISEEIFQSNKYHSLFTLVTNTGKRSISDLFERALNAAFILYYLCTNTTLFGKKFESEISQISTNKDATYVGGLILRNMQIIPSNIHSYEEECRINTIDIGVSAQPFCSLINHSCDPNVSRCSTGNGMLIYALVPIEPGSQIFDNYGSHYAVMNKFEREVKLKQYYFKCECRACKEDWPTYENLLPFDKLITNKKIKEEIETTLQNFNAYVEYAKAGDIESKHYLLEDLSKITSILIKNVPMPCCTVNNVIETLKRLFSLTYGNKFEIPPIN